MKMKRRNLLLNTAGLGSLVGFGAFPSFLSASALPTITDRYFVFAYFSGGWDNLLSLDPRNPDVFTQSVVNETGIQPAYERQDIQDVLIETSVPGLTFGPYIGDLAAHAEKLAVVRGMSMGAIAHKTARRHVLTGYLPAGTSVRRSSLSTMLASLLRQNEPIPNLVAGVESFNLDQPLWASGLPAGSLEDFHKALLPSGQMIQEGSRAALESFFSAQKIRSTTDLERTIYANRELARDLVTSDLSEYFNLDSSDSDMQALKEHYRIESGELGEGGKMALLASQALTKGVSRCVTIRVANNLDSHQAAAWENDQGPNQVEGFNSIAALIDDLSSKPFHDGSGDSWMDHTTIVCFSEFGRTAMLNSGGGRNHSLINSMLLLGAGISGGQVIGASSDIAMQSEFVDLATGQVSENGEILTNDHIARSLLHSIGITDDIGDYRKESIGALLSGVS